MWNEKIYIHFEGTGSPSTTTALFMPPVSSVQSVIDAFVTSYNKNHMVIPPLSSTELQVSIAAPALLQSEPIAIEDLSQTLTRWLPADPPTPSAVGSGSVERIEIHLRIKPRTGPPSHMSDPKALAAVAAALGLSSEDLAAAASGKGLSKGKKPV